MPKSTPSAVIADPAIAASVPAKTRTAGRKAPSPTTAVETSLTATRARQHSAKVATESGPGPAAASSEAVKPSGKLVRDSFTMPQADFALIAQLKSRALELKRPAKKSELLRAGLHALAAMTPSRLNRALDALTPLKPGRPKKV